jgi:tetratricopeptide (TPR) repeat protein
MIHTIEKILNEREIDRDGLYRGIKLLTLELKSPSLAYDAYGLISQLYYWIGETSSGNEKLNAFEQGVIIAKEGIKNFPNSVESHFWLGTNLGLVGQEKGIIASLFMVGEIEKHIKKSLELDETYFFGAPHRALGWLLHMLPPWPLSFGDNRKALQHLEKAIEFGSNFPLNYLYAGEISFALGKKDLSRKYLQNLIDWKSDGLHDLENGKMIDRAKEILKNL